MKKRKIFVIDTSAYVTDPEIIDRLLDRKGIVVVPHVLAYEMKGKIRDKGLEPSRRADFEAAASKFESILARGEHFVGITSEGVLARESALVLEFAKKTPKEYTKLSGDHLILGLACDLRRYGAVTVVTNDREFASEVGFYNNIGIKRTHSDDFKVQQVYPGTHIFRSSYLYENLNKGGLSFDDLARGRNYWTEGILDSDEMRYGGYFQKLVSQNIFPNDSVVVFDDSSYFTLGLFNSDMETVYRERKATKGDEVVSFFDSRPRDVFQLGLLEKILSDRVQLVLVYGDSNSGKSFMAVSGALARYESARDKFSNGIYLVEAASREQKGLSRALDEIRDSDSSGIVGSLVKQGVIKTGNVQDLIGTKLSGAVIAVDNAQEVTARTLSHLLIDSSSCEFIVSGNPNSIANPHLFEGNCGVTELAVQINSSERQSIRSKFAVAYLPNNFGGELSELAMSLR